MFWRAQGRRNALIADVGRHCAIRAFGVLELGRTSGMLERTEPMTRLARLSVLYASLLFGAAQLSAAAITSTTGRGFQDRKSRRRLSDSLRTRHPP